MESMFRDLVFLPVYQELTESAVRKMAAILNDAFVVSRYSTKEMNSECS
jgi:hypothetical protein